MRRPSLNAVRIFAVAARRRSIAAAAADLGVTPGAVSHQIKALEADLGVALFERRNNAIVPTEAGRQFFEEVEPSLAIIERASRALTRDANEVVVRASVSLAVRWLIPALETFKRRNPLARIHVETSHEGRIRAAVGVDITISYCRAGDDDMPGELLMADLSRPVLAPALLSDCGYKRLADIAKVPALKATTDNWDWSLWARAVGLEHGAIRIAHVFDTDDAAIHAAIAGLGMTLAPPVLTAKEFAAGSLVELPDARHLQFGEFRLIRSNHRRALAERLANWLLDDARAAVPGQVRSGPPAQRLLTRSLI